jgi:hypothetical protein
LTTNILSFFGDWLHFRYPQDKRLVEREGEIFLLDLEEKNSMPVSLNWFENQPTDVS